MNDKIQYTDGKPSVNSIIGEGTTLRGDFDLNGLLRIDGVFYGKVKTNGKILIGKNGVAECEIFAGTVVIGGKVKGEIIAMEKITLLSTGELMGNIKTPRLIIEEGVIFDGKCEIIEDNKKLEKIKKEYLDGDSALKPAEPVTDKGTYEAQAQDADKDMLPHGHTDKQPSGKIKQKIT